MRPAILAALVVLLASPQVSAQVGDPTGDVVFRVAGLGEPPPELLLRIQDEPGVRQVERLPGKWPTFVARGDGSMDPLRLAARLGRIPELAWAEPDRFFEPVLHGAALDDEFWLQLWHLENVGQNDGGLAGADAHAVPAWSLGNGSGVLIAVLDSGVDTDHPDLRVAGGVDVVDNDTDPNPNPADSNCGHGTLVAGLAAAIGNNGIGVAGVAWGAEIWAMRVLGTGGNIQDMRDAFVLATDAGVSVLNNSWGMMGSDCSPVPSIEMLNEAIDYARVEGRGGLGATVVFSAGNDGCESSEYPMLEREGVVAVGSLTDQDRKYDYSSFGPWLDLMSPSGPAGGSWRPGLWSTDVVGDLGFNGAGAENEYSPWMGGTSGAAPIVSGVVALMYAANERLTEADVRRVLCETAVRVDPAGGEYDASGWSRFYGCGRVDAAAAVAAVADEAPAAPAFLAPGPGDALEEDAVVLRWSQAADPDGDWLTWDVEVEALDGDDDDSAEGDRTMVLAGVEEPMVDIGGMVDVGEYRAVAWAVDVWGRGPASEAVRFSVVPVEDEDDGGEGCGCSQATMGWTWWMGVVVIATRRRRAVGDPGGRLPGVWGGRPGGVPVRLARC